MIRQLSQGVVQKTQIYLKLILSPHKLTSIDSQSSGALPPITGLEQDMVENGIQKLGGAKFCF